jgi:hypothetical protein
VADILFNSRGREFGFLSNFHKSKIVADGVEYGSVEHYYQAMKSTCVGERAAVRLAATPLAAKRAGKNVTIRPDWDLVKEGVMRQALWLKFLDPELRRLLVATAGRRLVEDVASDYYWGRGADGTGKNRLGALLEEIREAIIAAGAGIRDQGS